MVPIITDSYLNSNKNFEFIINSDTYKEHNYLMKYSAYAARFKWAWNESEAPKTQMELAKWLDYSQPMINYWLNGEKLPSMDTAIKISEKFGVRVEWLITGKGSIRIDEIKQQSSPLLDKFTSLSADQQKEVNDFIDFKLSQNNPNKPLTARPENVGGGGGVSLVDPLASYHRRQGDGPASKEFIDAMQHDWEGHEKSK
jgi:DNA-binding XRE family transcriptional regulator